MMLWLQNNFSYFLFFVGLFSLIIGSFLNVIIYRLPIIIKTQWRQQCHDFLGMKDPDQPHESAKEKFNLAWPNSHCPSCKKKLKPWHNIPLISFIFLRGRCAFCSEIISWQYPVVELLSAALALIVAFQFGATYQALALIILSYALIALTFIDLKHQLLPDDLTLSFLWIGLIVNMFGLFTDLQSAVIGALAGYLSLWCINYVFKLIKKTDGMGHGDFKLFALFGAWLGWPMLPFVLLASAGVGAIVSIALILTKKMERENPIPFGPYLAAAGFVAAVWGPQIFNWYLQ